jgi:voltage-gated potassium channel
MPVHRQGLLKLRHRLYEILEHGPVGDPTSRLVNWSIVLLIVISLFGVILESVPDLKAQYALAFSTIEIVALVVFSLEFCLRVWVAVEHTPLRHLRPIRARMRFITSTTGLIDLAAVLPFWFALLSYPNLEVLLVLCRAPRARGLLHHSPRHGHLRRNDNAFGRG